MRLILIATSALVLSSAYAFAGSCSSWQATCEKRGGSDCGAKFDKCMATGTWTEGAQFGGATHTGVTKK